MQLRSSSISLPPVSLGVSVNSVSCVCVFVHCVSYVDIAHARVQEHVPGCEHVDVATGFQDLFLCSLPYCLKIRPGSLSFRLE